MNVLIELVRAWAVVSLLSCIVVPWLAMKGKLDAAESAWEEERNERDTD